MRLRGVLLPRAAAHARLLVPVLAVVTLAVTPLGVAALLLGGSQARAFDVAMARAPARDVDAAAFVAGVAGAAVPGVVADTRAALAGALAPLPSSTRVTASTMLRELSPGGGAGRGTRVAYLGALDGFAGRARITLGRPPRAGAAPREAVLPAAAATALGLAPGDEVVLGAEVAGGPDVPGAAASAPAPAVRLRIVGVFTPLPGAGWDRDPLGGAGEDPRHFASLRLSSVPAYGPFVVEVADLLPAVGAGASTLDRLQVTASPDLSRPARPALEAVAAGFGSADARLASALHGRARVARVESALPGTLAAAHRQEAATRAAVLVVVLLAVVLSAAALALAGRLVAALRGDETALLAALGAGRRQLVAAATAEALLVAAAAAALAVPLTGLSAAALTSLPVVRRAGLAAGASVPVASLVAVTLGAVALAALLVVPALRPEDGAGALVRRRTGLLVRSGADVLAVALAAAGWWQLRVQPPAATGTDVVRAVAPVLCLVAGVLIALRALPPLLAAGDRLARRSRALVLPLAAFEAARRPQAGAAALLVALGAAAGTFAVATGGTWERAQRDQADLRVGTDLAVTLAGPPGAGDGTALAAATGGTVSPVTRRAVPIGQWVGDPGSPPQLVAVDTRRAGQLLRGRPPAGRSWAHVGAALAPAGAVAGVPLAPGGVPTLTGTATGGAAVPTRVVATARLVLQDASGLRVVREGRPVPLDGRAHPLALGAPVPAGTQVVAVDLRVTADAVATPSDSAYGGASAGATTALAVDVRVPGPAAPPTAAATGASWSVRAVTSGPDTPALGSPSVALVPTHGGTHAGTDGGTDGGTVVRAHALAQVDALAFGAGELVATAFAEPGPVPVAVSAALAGAVAARPGAALEVNVGATTVPARVVQVVPDVPSAPGGPAVLADVDVLSRALLTAGDLAPTADALWVGGPPAGGTRAEERARALGLGAVVSRAGAAEQLIAGPLRVVFPVALAALVPLALALVLAGTALAVTGDVASRALELARLRAVGLRRRDVRRGLLAQHGAVLALLVAAGAAVGWLCTRLLAPLLVRSETGGLPVPSVRPLWPWPAEGALVAALGLGCLLVVAAVVARQTRRADTAHLRAGAP